MVSKFGISYFRDTIFRWTMLNSGRVPIQTQNRKSLISVLKFHQMLRLEHTLVVIKTPTQAMYYILREKKRKSLCMLHQVWSPKDGSHFIQWSPERLRLSFFFPEKTHRISKRVFVWHVIAMKLKMLIFTKIKKRWGVIFWETQKHMEGKQTRSESEPGLACNFLQNKFLVLSKLVEPEDPKRTLRNYRVKPLFFGRYFMD